MTLSFTWPLRFALKVAAAALIVNAPLQAQTAAKPSTSAAVTTQKIVFAGGCFWCMEQPFDVLPGVISTTSGYIGGQKKDPTYNEISTGTTGHTEAVQVVFDPTKVSLVKLLDVFWHNIDPTTKDRQFCDRGSQYRPGIFYAGEEQKKAAHESRAAIEKSKTFKQAIVAEITEATTFYPAEDYHQDYYQKNSVRYKFYRSGCGRDARLKELWGDAAGKGTMK
jgi:peptide-methionine (S)-S-oxide reductase